ncbi:ABC transporter substrate-binding protein [Siccirubricoccus sp. G192]|uniref:ABC transporter substrate-binding protein n=1 Tax=Siccirubricoccus sp. G192 TaxID=2849651 RepID=UPI001C2B8744|nr:ABC transporter substrate-binding protein [Siccirubricoccus sp. G192]MBV1797051.1 ABC transporter substrate-binding protein [Siccirubricoccus sp. G192]
MKHWKALALTALLGLAPATSRAQVSDDVVRIGVLNDQSSLYADIGGQGSVVAARLAAEEFGNRILGRPIEIIFADNQNRADIAAGTARRWIDNERVDVLADGSASSSALAMQEVSREKRRIFLASGPASSDITGKFCSPFGFHFTYDTYALANGTGKALTQQGGDTWFFITADYAFGHALERDTAGFVREAGGRVLGAVRHPLNTADFSSFLLQAQASRAKVVGLANAGTDFDNALKQAAEFGLVRGGQRMAGLLVFITNIHALGLPVTQGLVATTSFYWDRDERTREWHRRFAAAHQGRAATMVQAGTYSGVRHYLRAVEAAGTDDAETVAAMMRRMPVQDMNNDNVQIRADGRVLHDMLLVQAKKPEESRGPWDYYTILARIPGAEAFRPLNQSECPLVRR